jgi:uncharacterized protein
MTTTRPDHASPWVLDVRKLGRRAGSMQKVAVELPVAEPLGLEVIAVPAGAELAAELQLESVTEGIWVSGDVTGTAVGECSRCLVEIEQPLSVRVRDLFVYPGSTTDRTTDEDELPRVVDDLIDLTPLVRDEIVLALPLAPVCRPDCPGLCPECGERFDDLEPGHSHEILDPRWAALVDRLGTDSASGSGSPEGGAGS